MRGNVLISEIRQRLILPQKTTKIKLGRKTARLIGEQAITHFPKGLSTNNMDNIALRFGLDLVAAIEQVSECNETPKPAGVAEGYVEDFGVSQARLPVIESQPKMPQRQDARCSGCLWTGPKLANHIFCP